MSLQIATLIPGLLLLALGLPLVLNHSGFAAALRAFPRSTPAAYVCFGAGGGREVCGVVWGGFWAGNGGVVTGLGWVWGVKGRDLRDWIPGVEIKRRGPLCADACGPWL